MATRTWIGATDTVYRTTTNWAGGAIGADGDDVIVNTANLSGAGAYPVGMPATTPIALNSLNVDITGDVDAPSLFSTGTNHHLTIGAGGCNIVEATGNKPTNGTFLIGSATVSPQMLSGCVGSITLCGGKIGATRFARMDWDAGSTLTFNAVAQSGQAKLAPSCVWGGTLNLGNTVSTTFDGGYAGQPAGTILNVLGPVTENLTLNALKTVGACTINIRSALPWALAASQLATGTVINIYDELILYAVSGATYCSGTLTLNAYAAFAQSGGTVAVNNVNLFGYPYITAGFTPTAGTVNGGVANAPLTRRR